MERRPAQIKKETHDILKRIKETYGIQIDVFIDMAVKYLAKKKGEWIK